MPRRETASPTSSGARTPTKSFANSRSGSFADLRPITPTSQSGSFANSGSFAASRPGTPAATARSLSAARSASPSRGASFADKSNPYLHHTIEQPAVDAPRRILAPTRPQYIRSSTTQRERSTTPTRTSDHNFAPAIISTAFDDSCKSLNLQTPFCVRIIESDDKSFIKLDGSFSGELEGDMELVTPKTFLQGLIVEAKLNDIKTKQSTDYDKLLNLASSILTNIRNNETKTCKSSVTEFVTELNKLGVNIGFSHYKDILTLESVEHYSARINTMFASIPRTNILLVQEVPSTDLYKVAFMNIAKLYHFIPSGLNGGSTQILTTSLFPACKDSISPKLLKEISQLLRQLRGNLSTITNGGEKILIYSVHIEKFMWQTLDNTTKIITDLIQLGKEAGFGKVILGGDYNIEAEELAKLNLKLGKFASTNQIVLDSSAVCSAGGKIFDVMLCKRDVRSCSPARRTQLLHGGEYLAGVAASAAATTPGSATSPAVIGPQPLSLHSAPFIPSKQSVSIKAETVAVNDQSFPALGGAISSRAPRRKV